MKVLIQEDQTKAVWLNQPEFVYDIAGFTIVREDSGKQVMYDTDSSFYKACAASGTVQNAYVITDGVNRNKIMLY